MRKGWIQIEAERCKGCALCVEACPRDLIEIDTEHVNAHGYHPARFVDPDQACTGCQVCAVACPDVGIRVFRMPREARQRKTAQEVCAEASTGG